jgi:ferrous iron transport protein B
MFNLFTPPCFAAIGAMKAEMENKKWFWGAIAFQLCMGYTVAFITYQVGTLFTTGAFGSGFLPGLIAVIAMIGCVVYLARKGEQEATAKAALKSA